jgi:hypothetical protein
VEKTTTVLAARYEVIGVEALQVRNMVRRPKANRTPITTVRFCPTVRRRRPD